jgi:hypothetical protein
MNGNETERPTDVEHPDAGDANLLDAKKQCLVTLSVPKHYDAKNWQRPAPEASYRHQRGRLERDPDQENA